ncbi:MAG TPA: hypothetical protein VN841_28325 [Bryobacteraceae bacterium]|nr:hypothetical protein [Bryobacteraceae bacterium]
MNRRHLEGRISRLEALGAKRKTAEPLLMLIESAEPERELLPDERVVIDRFRDAGNMVWARRRITSDPTEVGQHSEPGGFLVDLLTQFHVQCPWRKITGACRMCQGTPVAGSNSESCKSEQEVEQ